MSSPVIEAWNQARRAEPFDPRTTVYDAKGLPWSVNGNSASFDARTNQNRYMARDEHILGNRKLVTDRLRKHGFRGIGVAMCAAIVLRQCGIDDALAFIDRVAADQGREQ